MNRMDTAFAKPKNCRSTKNAFKELEAKNKLILDLSQDAIFLEKPNGEIIECNKAAYKMYGYGLREMIGLNLRDVVSKEVADSLPAEIVETSGEKYIRSVGKRKDGSLFPIDVNTKFIYLSGEKYLIAFIRDMSEYVNYQENLLALNEALKEDKRLLKKIAEEDYLTGLFNRRKIIEILQNELLKCHTEEIPLTLGIIDIDHFKRLNDTYGHAIGDEVLIEMANLFTSILPKDVTVGRYGGEEFLMIFPSRNLQYAITISDSLRKKIEATLFTIKNVNITISIGLVESQTFDCNEIIKQADDLLYLAKNSGKNTIKF